MAIPDGYVKLVNLLSKATKEDRVNWREMGENSGKFVVIADRFSFSITSIDDQNDKFVLCRVFGPDGKEIDSFIVEPGTKEYPFMLDLADRARRKARNIDDAIDALTKDLEGDGVIGQEAPPEPPGQEHIPF